MKKILALLFLAMCIINFTYADGLVLFTSEGKAQNHCPDDVVVWLNLPTGIWHAQGTRWYGNTKNGSFVCRSEAADSGDRASMNG